MNNKDFILMFAPILIVYTFFIIQYIIGYYRRLKKVREGRPVHDTEKNVWFSIISIPYDETEFPAFAISEFEDPLKGYLSVFSSRLYSYEMAVDEFLRTINAKKE